MSEPINDRRERITRLLEEEYWAEAEVLLADALERSPGDVSLLVLQGRLLAEGRGNLPAALAVLRQALKREPTHGATWKEIGRCLTRSEDFEEARQAFETALRLDPSCGVETALAGVCYRLGDLDRAATLAEQAVQAGDDGEAYRVLLACRRVGGEPATRLQEVLERARRAGVRHPDLDLEEARLLLEDGQRDRAREILSRILRVAPQSPQAQRARDLLLRIRRGNASRTAASAGGAGGEVEAALGRLEALAGLGAIKRELTKIVRYEAYMRERESRFGLPRTDSPTYHMAFTGRPGTGKTTVARLTGQIFQTLGVLSQGHLVEADRESLVAGFVGQTAAKTKQKIAEALDGILFIDEAYSLARGGENDFGYEAVDVLVKAMEQHRSRLIVILAGYPERMQELFLMNPGLRDRIAYHLRFEDYTNGELVTIGRDIARQHHYRLTPAAERALLQAVERERRNKNFSNARTVRNLLERGMREQAFRLSRTDFSEEESSTLEPIDFGVEEGESKAETLIPFRKRTHPSPKSRR